MAAPLVCSHGRIEDILMLPCTHVFHLDLERQWPPETLFTVGSRLPALVAVVAEGGYHLGAVSGRADSAVLGLNMVTIALDQPPKLSSTERRLVQTESKRS